MPKLEHILVVEDQEMPQDAIKYALAQTLPEINREAVVTYVTNFEAAKLAIASNAEFELIILDHRMPRSDVGNLEDRDPRAFSESLVDIGYTLIPEIREARPNCKVIGTSSMGQELAKMPQPDGQVDKSRLYSPEIEFSPMLRSMFSGSPE